MEKQARIEISKVKLLDKGEGVAMDYDSFIMLNPDLMEQVHTKHKIDSAHKPHIDLITAIRNATPFALDLVDRFPKDPRNATPEDYELSSVTGVSFSGDSYERIVFTVLVYTRKGKAYTFNTPLFDMDKAPEGYQYIEELIDICSKIEEEAKEYIGGKYAPNPQLEMELK